MNVLFVVSQRRDWPFEIPGVTVVAARDYLADSTYAAPSAARVFNLCRSDRHQGRGYYVSLLAEARGHQPAPDVRTIEDLQGGNPLPMLADAAAPQWTLDADRAKPFDLLAYFGRDPQGRNDAAARQLFTLLHAPLLHATFEHRDGRWQLIAARLLTPRDIASAHHDVAARAAMQAVAPPRVHTTHLPRPALAILYNRDAPDPPSNPAALERFRATAGAMGIGCEFLTRHDIERLPEFDALFIRDTTHVNHYTYHFARRAAAQGLIVIDDVDSIVKCTNKVYLHELFTRHQIPMPETLVVHRDNVGQILQRFAFPFIVKQPGGSFSQGTAKVHAVEQLDAVLESYFAQSELVLAQEWLPTEFDWRVGVLDGRPLYVCKYLMAPGHWQVVKREPGRKLEGATVAMAVGEAPQIVVKTAVRAAGLIGESLYGVDLKQAGERCCVIEVNDNPNIDAGNEDGVLKDALYREVLGVFLRRIRERGRLAAD